MISAEQAKQKTWQCILDSVNNEIVRTCERGVHYCTLYLNTTRYENMLVEYLGGMGYNVKKTNNGILIKW